MRLGEERAFAFLEVLQQELALYRKLLELVERQDRLVASAPEQELLAVLADKHALLERVEALKAPFAAERQAVADSVRGEFSVLDDEIAMVLGRLEETMRRILELEDRDIKLLQDKREGRLGEIKHLSAGKDMARAYRGPGGGGRMDQTG